jgi:hypothetical protein
MAGHLPSSRQETPACRRRALLGNGFRVRVLGMVADIDLDAGASECAILNNPAAD